MNHTIIVEKNQLIISEEISKGENSDESELIPVGSWRIKQIKVYQKKNLSFHLATNF